MMALRKWVSAILAVGLLTAVPVAASAAPVAVAEVGESSDEAIAQARETLATVQAVRAGEAQGDLTMLLRDLWIQRRVLPPAEFAQATDEFGRPQLPESLGTENFIIHYTSDQSSDDFATEAFVQETAAVFEEVYADQIERQGWNRPADDGTRGGDGRIDVYLQDGENFGFAAQDTDTCEGCQVRHGWMGMDNDYVGFGPEPSSALRATTAHEFHHLIQFATAANADPWLWEATATWQEVVVYPDDDARTFYVSEFAADPTNPLTMFDTEDESFGSHQYAVYVFIHYLADRFGEDVIRQAWEAIPEHDDHTLDALHAVLQARDSSFPEAFADFAAATAHWNDGGFPADVVNGVPTTWPEVTRTDTLTDGDTTQVVLDHTAFALYDIEAAEADSFGARITTDGTVAGAVAVTASGEEGVRRSVVPLSGGTATASLDGVAGDQITVAVINADFREVAGTGNEHMSFSYVADDSAFALEVSSEITGEEPAGPLDPGDAVDPGEDPGEEPGGEEPVDGPQDGLIDGDRVAGEDAVAQGIATSRALFADGAAELVVLATSENFPDALAGSGLAGARGPILFTPFSEQLDPRVAEEISRVTGSDGLVLTLGGARAVSESAAAQARAAAGDVPCGDPYPASCRYAGSGREETAALIAETVQQLSGGSTVLIARGDQFADAITGGAFAAWASVPMLLTPSTSANAFTAEWLTAHPEVTAVIVLGGRAAVDEETFAELGATDRVEGAERTETSVAIAEQLWSAEEFGGIILVNVRAEDGWPAALAAAVASAVFDAPQIGVENPPTTLSDPVAEYISSTVDGPIQAFGDEFLVSPGQLQEALATRDDAPLVESSPTP